MHASPFELLELPDGRWCVARIAQAAGALIAGSFAPMEPRARAAPAAGDAADPVGVYASRDEAERAIQRKLPAPPAPLSPFAAWLKGG
jgi:hypothetical protein